MFNIFKKTKKTNKNNGAYTAMTIEELQKAFNDLSDDEKTEFLKTANAADKPADEGQQDKKQTEPAKAEPVAAADGKQETATEAEKPGNKPAEPADGEKQAQADNQPKADEKTAEKPQEQPNQQQRQLGQQQAQAAGNNTNGKDFITLDDIKGMINSAITEALQTQANRQPTPADDNEKAELKKYESIYNT